MIIRLLLLAVAALATSCAADGNLYLSGDFTAIGIPAKIEYRSGKNPISDK